MNYLSHARASTVLLFGIFFPIVLLVSSYIGLKNTRDTISSIETPSALIGTIESMNRINADSRDYALYSLLYLENANKTMMVNKQVLKTTVIEIGFAVMSIGIMLLVLGIGRSDGVDITSKIKSLDLSFDVKTLSAGTAVFLAGALMSSSAGLLKNEYTLSEIPIYAAAAKPVAVTQIKSSQSLSALKNKINIVGFKTCDKLKEMSSKQECFFKYYFKYNEGELK